MASATGILGGGLQGASSGFMLGGPFGALAGGVLGGILGAFQSTPTFTPYKYNPRDVTTGQNQFLTQGAGLPGVQGVLQQANKIDNASYQKDASEFAPNLMGNVAQNGANTSALLSGNLSTGVQDATGKFGATGRDLGLTSDQLMQAGAGQLGAETKTATGLNPFNETSTDTLLSPAALLKRQDSIDLKNNQIFNQQSLAQFGAQNTNNTSSSILSGLGSLAGNLRGTGFNNGPVISSGYGFGYGDSGPTSDSMFDDHGNWLGGS